MDSGELIVSSGTLLRVFLLVLYCTVGLIYFRTILPRLTPISKRLASVFLAAQIFVIVVSLEVQPASRFEEWLWHLDFERNIPTTLAATQLTLVGCYRVTDRLALPRHDALGIAFTLWLSVGFSCTWQGMNSIHSTKAT